MWCSGACARTNTSPTNSISRPWQPHSVCGPARPSFPDRNISSTSRPKNAARESDDLHKTTAVYTTLDLRLQHAAERAVADGMQLVDKQLSKRKGATSHSSAGRAHRSRPSYRRSESALRRPQLRDQPIGSRVRQTPAWFRFQAVCLYGRAEHRHQRRRSRAHAGIASRRFAHHVRRRATSSINPRTSSTNSWDK